MKVRLPCEIEGHEHFFGYEYLCSEGSREIDLADKSEVRRLRGLLRVFGIEDGLRDALVRFWSGTTPRLDEHNEPKED